MNKLVIFALAALAVVAAAMVATPASVADDPPACFVYYQDNEEQTFEVPTVTGYMDEGLAVDAGYYGCAASLGQCFGEGIYNLVFDSSYVSECS